MLLEILSAWVLINIQLQMDKIAETHCESVYIYFLLDKEPDKSLTKGPFNIFKLAEAHCIKGNR